jgi:hypothetical protein
MFLSYMFDDLQGKSLVLIYIPCLKLVTWFPHQSIKVIRCSKYVERL